MNPSDECKRERDHWQRRSLERLIEDESDWWRRADFPASRRIALLILLLGASAASAACPLPVPADKGARIDEAFQHQTLSPSGFFELFWNSSGDSALAADRVPHLLAALDSARAVYQGLPGVWPVPLGPRAHYPVLVVRQNQPGATTLPFEEGGVDGLSWIQLDCDFARWDGDAEILLDVTCAHEVFHALQFAQGFDWRDLAFCESSAVWAEDQVYPDHDDWAWRFLPALLEDLHAPLDQADGTREYGAGAVVKSLLVSAGGWEPCREALLLADGQTRCWPALLATLGADAAPELARSLAELLHAGSAADLSWRVPELIEAAPVDRWDFTPLVAGSTQVPEGVGLLAGLSWRALPLSGAGALRLGAGECSAFRLGQANEPEALADSSVAGLAAADWLLVVNKDAEPRAGMQWLAWESSWTAPFRIWPNPAGRLRWVEFAGAPGTLEFFNILGRRLGDWTPLPQAGPQALLLPSATTGTVLVRVAGDESGQAITLR